MIENGKKVRIVMKRLFEHEPPTIFRGNLDGSSDTLLKILGRRFTKLVDTVSNRAEEKPLDEAEKIYVIPISSIRFVETIEKGSKEDELDEKVRSEQPLFRKGGYSVID